MLKINIQIRFSSLIAEVYLGFKIFIDYSILTSSSGNLLFLLPSL